MVRHNGPTIVVVSLYIEDSNYLYGEAFVGSISGDNAVVNVPVFSPIDRYEVTIQFNRSTPNLATGTVNACSPAVMCLDYFPVGTRLPMRRFF